MDRQTKFAGPALTGARGRLGRLALVALGGTFLTLGLPAAPSEPRTADPALAPGTAPVAATARALPGTPAATAQSLCDALIATMKQGGALTFAARRDQLAPEIEKDFDLGFMTRLVVGPPWRGYSAPERRELERAFHDYSIATYAQRFKSYDGERFEVDTAATPMPTGDQVVHTRLFPGGPDAVQLDYLERSEGGQWKIIDVFLNGSISELAARRSEYSATLRRGGAAALVSLLQAKSRDLGQ